MPKRQILVDITNYDPTAPKCLAMDPESSQDTCIDPPRKHTRTYSSGKASDEVEKYIAEEATAGRFWNKHKTPTSKASGNASRDRKKAEERAAKGFEPKEKRAYPKKYDEQHEYECNHAGETKYLDDGARKRARRESGKCDCPARLRISKLRDQNVLLIEHLKEHEGHVINSVKDRRTNRTGPEFTTWATQKIQQGHTKDSMRKVLALNSSSLSTTSSNLSSAPDALFFNNNDLNNLFRRTAEARGKLDDDLWASLRAWIGVITKEGGEAHLEQNKDGTFAFYFITAWQKKCINDGIAKDIICLDATHNTSFTMEYGGAHCPLFTLLGRDLQAGHGIPLAFMISSNELHTTTAAFLQWVKGVVGLEPRTVIIDCSATEAKAVRLAWPSCSIRYCHWHMMRAINGQLEIKIKVSAVSRSQQDQQQAQAASRTLQAAARKEFQALVSIDTVERFGAEWRSYRERWQSHPAWIKYLEDQWMPSLQRWAAFAQREGCQGITTNNLIESWHRVLKVCYLKRRRRQRVDILLQTIINTALPEIQQRILKLHLLVDRRRLSAAEKTRSAKADAIPLETAIAMTTIGEHRLTMDSFSREGVSYQLALKDGVVSKCSCHDHKFTHLVCKHMYLAARVLAATVQHLPGLLDDDLPEEEVAAAGVEAELAGDDAMDPRALAVIKQNILFLTGTAAPDVSSEIFSEPRRREAVLVFAQKLEDARHAWMNIHRGYAAAQ